METMSYLPGVTTLALDPSRCNGCRMCTTVCPHAVFRVQDGVARIARKDACMECGACARNCEQEAIQVEAGVGCAAAFISAALGIQGSCCCTHESVEGQPNEACGAPSEEDVDPAPC